MSNSFVLRLGSPSIKVKSSHLNFRKEKINISCMQAFIELVKRPIQAFELQQNKKKYHRRKKSSQKHTKRRVKIIPFARYTIAFSSPCYSRLH